MPANPNTMPHYLVLEAVTDTIADWVNRYRKAIGRRNELAHCDAREVAHAARDLGISPAELRILAAARPGSADLLYEILLALGIDPHTLAETEPITMRDLQRLCVTCRNKNRCRRELDTFRASEHFGEYCPNAVTIQALVSERSS